MKDIASNDFYQIKKEKRLIKELQKPKDEINKHLKKLRFT